MERNDGASRVILRLFLALVIFGVTFLGVMVVAGATCFFLPRQYYSKVTMEVKQPVSNAFTDPTSLPSRDPNLQATQYQVIQSKEILYPIIDNLKLVEAWSKQKGKSLPKETVYVTLLGRLSLSPIRNTDLMEIGVYSTDRVEAANIANMIAVVYQKVRLDDQMQIQDSALAQLRGEVGRQRKEVEQMQAKMKGIQKDAGIVDANPEVSEEILGTTNSNLERSQMDGCRTAKVEFLSAKKVLEEAERRLSTASVELKMSMIPIKIWEKAEPAIYPAKPNVTMILFLAVGIGLILGTVFAGIYLRVSLLRGKPAASR